MSSYASVLGAVEHGPRRADELTALEGFQRGGVGALIRDHLHLHIEVRQEVLHARLAEVLKYRKSGPEA